MRRLAGALLALLLVASCDAQKAAAPAQQAAGAPSQAKAPPPAQLAGLPYVEVLTGGATAGEELPMVVAMHGLGDRPEAFAGLFRGLPHRARVIVPRAIDPHGGGFSWFAISGSVPQDQWAEGIRAAAVRVTQLLGEATRAFPTRDRPIVTGFSQGGMLSFALAELFPSQVSAAFPLGGTLPPSLVPRARDERARYPRLVALHGEADTRVPIGPTRDAVEKLKSLGIDAELRPYPGVAHTVSAEMRRDLYALVGEAIERTNKKD